MNNQLKVLILSLLVLLILLTIYMIMDVPNSKSTEKNVSIQIQPIKIAPLTIKTETSIEKKNPPILPIDILSKLKTASEQSKEAIVPSKEEQSNNILSSLKKKVEAQIIKKVVIQKIPIEAKITKKKTIKKKIVIKKKIIIKKETKPKVATKIKPNKPIKRSRAIKTFITSKKELPQKKKKLISREKEVSLYNKQYANTLEVVNVSDTFELKEENILPDSHYFETIKEVKKVEHNAPLEFVKKLGVIRKSANYESDFSIPEKEELAKEGIVHISNASLETKEIKNLEFVNTLGVIEISQDFETLDADKHLN